MTVSGSRGVADVTGKDELTLESCGLLIPSDWGPHGKGKFGYGETHTLGECHVNPKTQPEGMYRQAKEDQVAGESPEARREVWQRPFPSTALPTSCSGLLASRTVRS